MKKQAPYSDEELNNSVKRIETLHGVLSRTFTNYRTVQEETLKQAYRSSYDRLARNVETAEKRFQFQQDKVAEWEAENGGK